MSSQARSAHLLLTGPTRSNLEMWRVVTTQSDSDGFFRRCILLVWDGVTNRTSQRRAPRQAEDTTMNPAIQEPVIEIHSMSFGEYIFGTMCKPLGVQFHEILDPVYRE